MGERELIKINIFHSYNYVKVLIKFYVILLIAKNYNGIVINYKFILYST